MSIINFIPFYSQYIDVRKKVWRHRACGIVSLKMLMEYWQRLGKHKQDNLPSIDKLFEVGVRRRSYIRNVGWRHSGLVGLAKLYGFKHSQNYDLSKKSTKAAMKLLKKELKRHPVIVSVYHHYQPGQGGHLPILVSLTSKQAVLIDPEARTRKAIKKIIPRAKFLKSWKKRFIAVRP